ncbi:MAG: hypothetical protein M1825_000905 [Sarcosagium campestre]|nr:MAG: hypothetical protein M1825_000905 [Sarcosagium campestre]
MLTFTSYGTPVAAALHYGADYEGAILAEADLARLSMSGDGKNYPGFPSSRSYAQPSYGYSTSDFPQQQLLPSVEDAQSRPREGHQLLSDSPYQAGTIFDQHQHQHQQQHQHQLENDAQSRILPEVQSCSPCEGSAGTTVLIHIYSATDLRERPYLTFSVMFGSSSGGCKVKKLNSQDEYFRYLLAAHAPPSAAGASGEASVPIHLCIKDEAGQVLGTVRAGDFLYISSDSHPTYGSPQPSSRKRKHSEESARSPVKRTSNAHLRALSSEEVPEYSYSATDSPFSDNLIPLLPAEPVRFPGSYDQNRPYAAHPMQRSRTLPYSHSPTFASPAINSQSMPHKQWTPSSPSVGPRLTRSPVGSTAAAPIRQQQYTNISPSSSVNPKLIRTSTMCGFHQQTGRRDGQRTHYRSPDRASNPATGSGAGVQGGSFNPYSMWPQKAVLKLRGDLDAMGDTSDWDKDETDSKRRIVLFQRSQDGNAIHASFRPVTQDCRQQNIICISCIWWEEKNECYVTSVDTIALLESLVAVRFTVEEKNRIRRNLEGFRPLTVSKGKQDSEEFFKVIMGFPAPKPRNIEKDVKVFPWKILAHALKKIIGKYSASYASTAAALPTPVSSSGYVSGGSGTGTMADASPDYQGVPSPRSLPESIGSAAIHSSMHGATSSPRPNPSATLHSSVGPPELRLSVLDLSDQSVLHNNWSRAQNSGISLDHSPHYNHPGTRSSRGSAWDYAYLESSATPSTGGPHSLHYNSPASALVAARDLPEHTLHGGHAMSRA